MVEDLQELRTLVGKAFTTKAKKVAWASRYMKIVLVLGGALLAGAAAVFGTGPLWPLTIPQILGLAGSILAFMGGIYVAFVEDDSAEALDRSRQALDKATDYERQATEIFDELLEYEDAVNRLKSLYTCYSAGRGTIEQGMAGDSINAITLVEACLRTMKTDLKVALGFNLTDFWTISVYQTVVDTANQSHMLKCIAHDRSIDCEIGDARTWRVGVGSNPGPADYDSVALTD